MDSMASARGYGLKGPLSGKKTGAGTIRQIPNFTPEQMNLLQSLFPYLSPESHLGRLASGDQSYFSELEEPAMRQFNKLQGQTASRFSLGGGRGSLGQRHGTGFQNALTQDTQDFASNLQAQRMNLRREALQDLFEMSESLLGQRPYQTYIEPKRPSFFEKLLGGAGSLIGGGIGAFRGPFGLAFGSQVGNAIGSAFNGQQSSPLDYSSLLGLSSSWNQPSSLAGQSLMR